MGIKKKRISCVFIILSLIVLFSISVLAETAYFYWYDAGGTQCKVSNEEAVADPGTTTDSDPAPYNDPTCCDVEGSMTVDYYTDFGELWSVKSNGDERRIAYDINYDTNSENCVCYGKTWKEGIYFESNKPSCCGDDSGEFFITQGAGTACCNEGGTNVCVPVSGRCRYQYGKETSCHDGIDNDCSGETDCNDDDCKTGTEEGKCRDKIDNDCDGLTDCSDIEDCELNLDCIGCYSEVIELNCEGNLDNDCDEYIDCVPGNADSDCVSQGLCPGCTTELCNNGDDDNCNGKIDCADESCLEQCGGTCTEGGTQSAAENTQALCIDGFDNDCDGLIDNLDRDCPGCSMNTKLCSDGSCKESCDPVEPQGCVGEPNGACEEGEGCACGDCSGKRDSCDREIICDSNDKTCKCPSGTTMCSDNRCRTKCFVCGDGILEEGEECDKNNPATTTCPDGCTGESVTCKADCTWDTSSCSCPQCDPTKTDNYCCVIPEDNKCDSECTTNADSDCKDKCTSYTGDCCEDKKDGTCDFDCINYKDPDCSTSCNSEKDDCCNAGSDGKCDPDCDYYSATKFFIDPDCETKFPNGCTNSQGDCCNNNKDETCDHDCITGVDPDCKCSNGIIDTGETCDTINLDTKTCNNFFTGYGGLLTCFNNDGEHPCHFDTSGCHKIPEVCTGGSCSFGKDCRCPECIGKQSSCGYGAVCDATARCACIEGTTLCKDSTCRTVQNCKDYDGGEQLCIGTANGVCDVGEGCGCPDCEGKKGPCNALSVCQDSVCTGCSLKNAYWSNIKTGQAEECIGSGNEIKLTTEGLPGCEDKTIALTIPGVALPVNKAVFKNGKAELVWKADLQGNYQFEASLEGGDDKILSKELEVEYCIKECDVDCDEICETSKCVTDNPTYCKNDIQEGEITLDVNTMTGYCEECDKYGLSKGQDTCAAYYDCTLGWWKDTTPTGWTEQTKTDAMEYLEWGDCGDPKVEPSQLGPNPNDPDHGGRRTVSGNNMRNRLICPPGLTKQQCCGDTDGDGKPDQKNCYCKLPKESDMIKKGLNCGLPAFRPTEIKACLSEEKFPFFTNMNILIVVLILTGFYIWKTRKD